MKKIKIIIIAMALVLLLPINVNAAPKVKLSSTKKTIEVGKTVKISLKNNKKKVKWSVSNGKIKIVKKTNKYAKIKAVKRGTATLKAKVGKKTYKCKITVKNKTKESAGTPKNFDEKLAEKNISKKVYDLGDKIFVILESKYTTPTSIEANCYFFDINGNPVKKSWDYCFWLEDGKSALLQFEKPNYDYNSIDIQYEFYQSYLYIGNESIINNLSVSSNIVKDDYDDKMMITLSNASNKEVSSCSVIIKYYDSDKNIAYFQKKYFYDVKAGNYSIESISLPKINFDYYELYISTAQYDSF